MLQQQNRFHGRRSVTNVMKKGSGSRGKLISVKQVPAQKSPRIAVVVSKKIDKSAVVRNSIRRRVISAIKSAIESPDASFDSVFIIHSKQILDIQYQELQEEVKRLLLDKKHSH